jgi:hypothetical protein
VSFHLARAADDRTIAFPCYDGNGMYFSMGNLSAKLDQFRKEARRRRAGYQTLINEALAEHIRKDVA